MHVLILDADKRKAVPVVRSLGAAGVRVTCASAGRFAAGAWSRHCSDRYRCPPVGTPAFVPWLVDRLDRDPADVVLGLEDDTIIELLAHPDEIASRTALPYPPIEAFLDAADKARTVAVARRAGVPAPRTLLPETPDSARRALVEVGTPCVIKARRGSGGRGTVLVQDAAGLDEYLAAHGPDPMPLVQELVPHGGAYGVCALYDGEGRCRASVTHRRVREYPVSGGPSTLAETVSHPELEALAHRLLEALGWRGVAMVEFQIDARDGSPRLMEVNPRFWGSLPLAIAAGVDFPQLLCRLAVGDEVAAPKPRLGVRGRWLVPGDILHFLANPERFHLEPSFFRFFDRDTHDFLLSWRDPLPLLVLLAGSLVDRPAEERAALLRRGW